MFDAYTQKTGVKVKFITDKEAPLMQRIKAEGENATADLLLTVDAGNLWQAEQMGILQPFTSKTIDSNIPLQYRSSAHQWTGLSLRARTLAYSTERVKPTDLTTYEALADKQWEGRLCLRTAKKVYNQSLTATLIEVHGAEKTEQILKGWVNNLSTRAVRRRYRQYLLLRAPAQAEPEPGGEAVLAEPGRPWRACEPVGYRPDQTCPAPGSGQGAGGVDDHA